MLLFPRSPLRELVTRMITVLRSWTHAVLLVLAVSVLVGVYMRPLYVVFGVLQAANMGMFGGFCLYLLGASVSCFHQFTLGVLVNY